MLWSARNYAAGNPLAGGPNNLSGKYFMEHPSLSPVEIYIDSRADIAGPCPASHRRPHGELGAAADRRVPRRPRAAAFCHAFPETPQPATTDVEIQSGQDYYLSRSTGYLRIMPFFIFEQTPNVGSYVALSQKLGKDGTPLARLNWYIQPRGSAALSQGGRALLRAAETNTASPRRASSAMPRRPTGRPWASAMPPITWGPRAWPIPPRPGWSDSNCQVFGLDNMFVAGSSVFPSTDIVNPTLNLTALTARLANFILTTAATARAAPIGSAPAAMPTRRSGRAGRRRNSPGCGATATAPG